MGRAHVYLLCRFLKFHAVNVVISLSDLTPNSGISGVHKSPVNPEDPPNISNPKMLMNV